MADDNTNPQTSGQTQGAYDYSGTGSTPQDQGTTGGKPTGKYKSTVAFTTIIKVPENPLTFDQNYFLQLIAGSIALRIDEKEKIIESIPKLSQRQVDELMKIFEEEKEEFDKLAEKYPDQIRQLREKAKADWKLLESKADKQSDDKENQSKVDDIKNLLKKKDDSGDSSVQPTV